MATRLVVSDFGLVVDGDRAIVVNFRLKIKYPALQNTISQKFAF